MANALGLSGVDITSFNPFAAGVDQNLALVSEKVANQIISTVSTISSAAEGTGANKDIAFDKAVGAVSSAVINEINDGNSTDALSLSDTSVLNQIKSNAKSQLSNDVTSSNAFEAVLEKGMTAAKNVNEKIETASNLSDNKSKAIFSLDTQLSNQVLTAAQNQLAESGSNSVDFQLDSMVDAAVDAQTANYSSGGGGGGGGGGGAAAAAAVVDLLLYLEQLMMIIWH